MRNSTLQELLKGTHGTALSQPVIQFSGIGTDTRKDLKGQVFWALQGESFDAHDFLPKAIAQGATGLVIHRRPAGWEEFAKKVTIIEVKDTLRALQDFANFTRHEWGGKVIGITGSNGKTTSKEFCAQVLGSVFKVHSNKGSFNNHFGLPFNLLATPADAQFVLAEMGMNHAGEITRLCEIADPDVVVCTMVGRGHIEHFGSIEKIAEAKEEIYKAARPNATRIYNLDNEWTRKMFDRAAKEFPRGRLLTFAESEKADVNLRLLSATMNSLTVEGQIQGVEKKVEIPVFGAQNMTNLRVVATVGLSCGMTPEQIWTALPLCKTAWGRNQFLETKRGAQILFDAYNANPDSMKALLQNVPALASRGRKIGVFAEMLELGDYAPAAHRELGEQVGRSGLDVVYFYGPDAAAFEAGIKASGFSKKLFISDTYEESIASEVAHMLDKEDLALVKGSRGMKMERFVFLCDPVNFEAK
jgi:UDP-N-acetylmuramoyl-tripeptide--D-alanyl-D-alanine ligase